MAGAAAWMIVGYLVIRAWPVLSWSFLFTQNPATYMTTGGLWAPIVGTFYLVLISLSDRHADRGPGGDLPERARQRQLGHQRSSTWPVVNLAGVPSIASTRLFGVGAFVLFARMGRSVHGRVLHTRR